MLLPQRNFYIQAITRLPSRRSKRITVARQSRNLTPLPLVTLVAVVLFYKLTQSISQKIHGFNTFFHFKSRLFFIMQEISTKVPREAPAVHGRHGCKGSAGFVSYTFVLRYSNLPESVFGAGELSLRSTLFFKQIF